MLRIGQETNRQMDRGGRIQRLKSRVFCDVRAYVSCRGYVGIPLSAWFKAMNQGGTAKQNSSLTDLTSVRVFYFQTEEK